MHIFVCRLKELSEIASNNFQAVIDLKRLKRDLSILVIDDGVVPFLDILQRNDYQIKHYQDLTDLKAVTEYAVILCDIKGVGSALNPTLQGAHIVKQIKKLYPFKQVIAFTANTGDAFVMDSVKSANAILPKDADADQWITALDKCLQNYSNPVKQWVVIRNMLLENHVSTKTVAILESEFVEAVISKDSSRFLRSRKSFKNMVDDASWDILKQFAASVLSKVVLGA